MNYLRPSSTILFVILATGCDTGEPAPPKAPPAATLPSAAANMAPKVKIKVLADGSLFVDGQAATLDFIDQRLAELAKVKGVVWYYREAGQSEPPEAATMVIKLVIKHQLPISMSSNPDFSDTIDDQGVSRLRPSGG